jgi:hypothetical protein
MSKVSGEWIPVEERKARKNDDRLSGVAGVITRLRW